MRALNRLAAAAAALLLSAACGNNTSGAPAPSIDSFKATPASISKGTSSTLAWTTTGTTRVSLDNGIGEVGGSNTSVAPVKTTTYTLTAAGAGGSTTAKVTFTVTAEAAPVISSFTATPATVAKGSSSMLSWQVAGATSVSIAPGVGAVAGTQSQATVTPLDSTTYTLTATGTGGTATKDVIVTVRPPVLHLDYVNPTGTAGAVRLVKNVNNSTDTVLQLDLVVGAQPISAFGLAMNLPFDGTRAGLAATEGFVPSAALGSSQPLSVGLVPTAGPLQGVLVVGLARSERGVEAQIPAGATIFSLKFSLVPNAPVGVVFDGVVPGKLFDAAVLRANGSRSIEKTGFDLGQMVVAL